MKSSTVRWRADRSNGEVPQMAKNGNLVVGLDTGTTKVCAIVAEMNGGPGVDIIGLGHSPSRGLRKGVVVDIEATVDSIRRAVEDAGLMAGVEVRSGRGARRRRGAVPPARGGARAPGAPGGDPRPAKGAPGDNGRGLPEARPPWRRR